MPVSGFRAAAAILISLLAALPFPLVDSAGHGGVDDREPSPAARVQPPPDPLDVAELLSQDLTVHLYPENRSISVEGSLRLWSYSDLTRLTLYLHQTLDLLNITQNGEPLLYTRNVERLTIDLAYPLSANSTTNLSFYYNGTMWYLEDGKRQDCVGWEGAYVKGSTFWYLRHHASDWFDCRLKLCCPPNWTAIADGELESEEHSAEWANYTWVNDMPCLRPAFAAGNYSVASRDSRGINYSVFTYPQHAGLAENYLDEAVNIQDFYSRIVGTYARRSFKIVETAHQTMSGYACSGFVMLYPTAFSGGTVRYNLLAHEMGHEWFPFATGYHGWAYPWLWEAFPEYLSCLYEIEYYGVRTRLEYDYNEYVKVHALPDVRTISSSDWDTAYSTQIVYAKGAWVLRMLHGIVGTAGFNAILKEYIDNNLWGYGSAQAFVATAARHSPIDLADFWDRWLNTTKALDVSLPAARQYENGTTFRLELWPVNLLNGSNPADIRIEYADMTFQTVNRGWDGKSSPVVLEVPSGVKQVRLDAESWLLDVDRNNQAAVPLQSGELFELHPEPPSLPENLTEGEETILTAYISNDGQYLARGVGVAFLIDGCYTAGNVLEISAQSWALATANWTPEQEGLHNITVSVDPGDGFHEWNEWNNNASIAVDVAPPPPGLDVWLGNLTAGDILGEGMRYAFNVTVRNRGDAALDDVSVEYLLDGSSLGRRGVTGLAVGEEKRVSLEWTATRGHHNLSVRADPDGLIGELDEENNIANHSFFVRWHDTIRINFTPANPRTLEPVTFSVDGDAEEYRFLWDDETAGLMTTERVVVHTFMEGGRYSVKVEGLAGGWGVGEATADVIVSNRPPEVAAYYDPASPLSLSTVVFTARTLDLDGMVLSVHWEFGDGANGTGNRAEHSYARPGNYTVRCTAHDNKNGENATSILVTIGNRPPNIGWTGLPSALVGKNLNFSANAWDPDGTVLGCRWNFGDGSSAEGENVSHRYTRPGTFLVTVTVQDDFGAWSNLTRTVNIKDIHRAGPAQPDWIWLPVPMAMAGIAAAATWLIWSRRRISKQRDDFFQPPPREGQNP